MSANDELLAGAPVLTWPHDQLSDPEQPQRTIDMLRSRQLELPEFHAHELSIANMLAILDAAVIATRAANAALAARCGELQADANRYRWLRVNNHHPALFGVAELVKRAEYLDAAIDAALASQAEGETKA